MTNFLSLICALGVLAGVFAFTRHGSDDVSFVQLGAAPAAVMSPLGAATFPG